MIGQSSQSSRRLVVWGLATFHAAGFVLALLVLLYSAGSLGSLLQSLNTAVGLVLFGALWATNWLCTGQALRRMVPVSQSAEQPAYAAPLPRPWAALGHGALWGGLNGLLFLACLFAVLLPAILTQGVTPDAAAAFGFFVAIGMVVASLVGAAVGVVFGLLDYVLLVLAEAASAPPASQRRGFSTRI